MERTRSSEIPLAFLRKPAPRWLDFALETQRFYEMRCLRVGKDASFALALVGCRESPLPPLPGALPRLSAAQFRQPHRRPQAAQRAQSRPHGGVSSQGLRPGAEQFAALKNSSRGLGLRAFSSRCNDDQSHHSINRILLDLLSGDCLPESNSGLLKSRSSLVNPSCPPLGRNLFCRQTWRVHDLPTLRIEKRATFAHASFRFQQTPAPSAPGALPCLPSPTLCQSHLRLDDPRA
jgi:hypothetical protein